MLDSEVMKEVDISFHKKFENVRVWASDGFSGNPPADATISMFSRIFIDK